MNTPSRFAKRLHQSGWILLGLLPAMAQAVNIDQQPLVIGKPPPPNILFILDNSTSMSRDYMPDNAPSGNIRRTTYPVNLVAYNPLVTYEPWYKADGTKMDDVNASNTGATIVSSDNFRIPPQATGTTNLTTSSNRCFHTPRTSTSNPTTNSNLYLWRFNYTGSGNSARITHLERCNAASSGTTFTCGNTTGSPPSGCNRYELNDPVEWTHGSTTVTRTVLEEWQNYANWYHYYRTRAKMAKGAASRAFAGLFADVPEDQDVPFRIGYTTINVNATSNPFYRIPVGNDNGLFQGTNRATWYSRLYNTTQISGTPLRAALGRAGEYFRETGPDGPWGPEETEDQLSCRQNFAILTSDGYWNGDAASNTGAQANVDNTDGEEITGPGGQSYTYTATRPYADSQSNTLADVAMYYWKNDLRQDLKNDVPTSANNPAFWQHMVTFAISIGEGGTLTPSDSVLQQITNGTINWPNPISSSGAQRIDDMWHAAVNGRGSFIVASDSDQFAEALTEALGAIRDRLGSNASLATNSTALDQGDVTYQAQYWSGTWRGDLAAYPVVNGRLADTPSWRASTALPAWQSRRIYFNSGAEDPDDAHQPFTWDNVNAAGLGTALGSASIVNYLRGDKSNEQTQAGTGTLRARTSLLGDIVNSQPVYVGSPNPFLHVNASFTGASQYTAFAESNSNRTPVIYVGGNDGMLHGFNAATGAETYAFIPKTVIESDLADIADPNYGKDEAQGGIPHRYFVDGELTVADVYSAEDGWRTVLVGTLGRGGRGVFALDVTDPADVTFLWEKAATDVPQLGNVLGKPVIVKLGNNDWRVLIGNGMNSSDGTAKLLMFDVFTGDVTVVGTNNSTDNGLSGVIPWDSNGDGFTDLAYAGDRLGNLWRFTNLDGTPSAAKLFEARGPDNNVQPITAAPMVGIHLKTKQRWVFFGTGQYLNTDDINDDSVQSWYGLIDNGSAIGSRSALVERAITDEGEVNGFPARVIESPSAGDMTGKRGWYIDLVSPENGEEGERMITQNQYRYGALIGTTRIPDGSDPCNPTGRGFVMAIDPFTGARLSYTFFDLTRDGSFDSADMLNGKIVSGVGFGAGPNNPVFVGSSMHVSLDDGSTSSFGINSSIDDNPVSRRSWRELIRE